MKDGFLDPVRPVYSIGQNRNIKKWSAEAVELARRNVKESSIAVSRLLLCILHEIFTVGNNKDSGILRNKNVQNIITYMQNHLSAADFDLSEFCEQNNFSYEYIRKVFRKTTGISPALYFSQLKFTKAKALLVSSEETIARIGHSLGFEDPYYFSRWFSKLHGNSPRHFRESYKNFS
jgi:AraC-like DNA-binding protein